jgi:plasmid stability protein
MRTAFTTRLPNHLHSKLKVRSAELGLSMQDCLDEALERWLGLGRAPVHGEDCPLARAPRDFALVLEEVLKLLEAGGPAADFLVGGLKYLARRRGT